MLSLRWRFGSKINKSLSQLTQIDIVNRRPEGERKIFTECIQNLGFNLANSITVKDFANNFLVRLLLNDMESLKQ